MEVAADETFDTPVFTTTVARGTVPMKTGSVDVRLGAIAWNHYWWRVTARDDVGFLRSKTRDFTILADGRRHSAADRRLAREQDGLRGIAPRSVFVPHRDRGAAGSALPAVAGGRRRRLVAG